MPSPMPRIFALVCLCALCGCVGGPEGAAIQARSLPGADRDRETIWDLFGPRGGSETEIAVNRDLWVAAQDVLDFMPLETADPFTGLLSYGYGAPPGGGSAYRGTVRIQGTALDPRALSVSLSTRSGPVDAATRRAVEDAILGRARQIRMQSAR